MFEVAAGKPATRKRSREDVRDVAIAEVHDPTRTGAKPRTTARRPASPSLDRSMPTSACGSTRSAAVGGGLARAHREDMATIHDADGAGFATAAQESPNARYATAPGAAPRVAVGCGGASIGSTAAIRARV